MKKAKKILSVFLALLMIATIIPMSSITASATQSVAGNFYRNYTLTGNGADDIVAVAQAQAGRSQASLGYTEAWCADFVSDCARLAGVEHLIPFNGSVSALRTALLNAYGMYVGDRQKGDIVFYWCNYCEVWCHVGIVLDGTYSLEGNVNGQVYTVGGNSNYVCEEGHQVANGAVTRQYIRPNWGAGSSTPPSTSYFTSVWADGITENDATIHATIYGTNLSTCGFYIGKSESAMEKRTETVNGYVENIWYTLSSDYGTLQPGTTYYYKFFVTVGGTEYCSDVKTFKTSGNTYTISYNANGGTGAPASQTKAQGTTLIITETVPTRKGYTFLGWSTSSTATTATYCAGSHFTTDANTTLYAVWRADEYSGICGENNLTWHLNVGTGVLTIFGNGAMDNYTSSSKQPWYDYRDFIKTVVISDGVTSIGNYAFYGYTNIVNITISDNVSKFSSSAFENTGYYNNESNWENGVLYIDKHLIDCKPNISAEYAVKDGTKTIAFGAFYFCDNLTKLSIPASVTTIPSSGFITCPNLTSIIVDKNNPEYSSDEYGVLFNKDKTTLIAYPQGNTRKSYAIPDSVTKIDSNAFFDCKNLTNVNLPVGVTTIGLLGFYGCKNLTSVEIPDGVTTIEQQTFYGCTNLKTVKIPDSVTIIGRYAFAYCENLESIEIPAGVTEIDSDAFFDCKNLTNIVMANSVKKIGIGTFEGCSSLTDVYYIGTEEQWNEINISSSFHGIDNDALINANRHYCEERVEKQPTCEEDGYTAGLYCTECKEFVKNAQVIPATGHNYNSVVTNPTCTQSGYTTYTCSCGDSYIGNYVNALGHTYNPVVTQPTCTEKGYTTYTCVCGESYVANVTPAKGHIPGKWEVVIIATPEKDGKAVQKCSVCGEVLQEKVLSIPDEPDIPDINYTFNIQTPSTTTIRHKDGIILHAVVEGNAPEGCYIKWSADNDNFKATVQDDGNSLKIVSDKNGYTMFTATLYDADGDVIGFHPIEMRSKAGLFDKIGGFFRSLFGSTKIYEY